MKTLPRLNYVDGVISIFARKQNRIIEMDKDPKSCDITRRMILQVMDSLLDKIYEAEPDYQYKNTIQERIIELRELGYDV